MKREETEYGIQYTPEGHWSRSISVDKPRTAFGGERIGVTVNWGALGAVSIAEAISFRDALSAAIEDAQKIEEGK